MLSKPCLRSATLYKANIMHYLYHLHDGNNSKKDYINNNDIDNW